MSIEIRITNEDSRENAIVVVKSRTLTDEQGAYPDVELKGGESVVRLVHDEQKIIVEEIQNG